MLPDLSAWEGVLGGGVWCFWSPLTQLGQSLPACRCGGRIWPKQGVSRTAGKPRKVTGVPKGALHRQA